MGIVSTGHKKCLKKGLPDIYTDVSQYVDWIKEGMFDLFACTEAMLILFRDIKGIFRLGTRATKSKYALAEWRWAPYQYCKNP